jgi:hypothetical protein
MRFQTSFISLNLCLALCGCDTASGPGPASVEIKGGIPGRIYVDQTFAGVGLQRYEGRRVVVRIGRPIPDERTAYGQTEVYKGSFAINFSLFWRRASNSSRLPKHAE